MRISLSHKFEDIISIENLLEAWKEFISGKKKKKDVQEFSLCLMDNIFSLHFDLANLAYKHSQYQAFRINDPKPRIIHKATVRDRLLHHAIYRLLYPFFDKTLASGVDFLGDVSPLGAKPQKRSFGFLYGFIKVGEYSKVKKYGKVI